KASSEPAAEGAEPARSSAGSCRLLHLVQLLGGRFVDGLNFARWPANDGFLNVRVPAQTEMQPPVVLSSETTAARNFLHLLLAIPKHCDLGTDRAAVTPPVI